MASALDIETTGKQDGYALEPWRYPKDGHITSIAVCRPDDNVDQIKHGGGSDLIHNGGPIALISSLDGEVTYGHNLIFDIAWLLNYVPKSLLNKVIWRDTMLAAKWMLNGQKLEKNRKFGLDLDNLITTFLDTHPLYDEFHEIKSQKVAPNENPEYWLRRGRLDAILTKDLGKFFYSKMPESIRLGYDIECRCLVPIAESWLHGIELDLDKNEQLQDQVNKAKKNIAKSMDRPEAMFTSPKQLANFLFNVKGIKPIAFTPTGNPSTGKEVLMDLYYKYNQDPDLEKIMAFKNLATMQSKFLNGIEKCTAHNGKARSHAAPRLFGTITGRMTYSNKTLKKYFIGLAQHQIPRMGPVKGLLKTDEGYIVQFDAAAQELRFVGQIAGDENIIKAFNDGIDLHSDMAANISGWTYQLMMERFHGKDTEAYNFRQAGKLTNLSCQYRIGAPALAKKFFTTYQIFIDQRTAYHYLNTYKRSYPGVVEYWERAIKLARETGYAESIGGRRFRLIDWNRHKWMTESNAINHPIQGSGADHMEVAIATINENFEDVRLLTVMHDGIYWWIPNKETAYIMSDYLNAIDFSDVWQKEVHLPLPFDGEIGKNFKELKEFTYE